MRDFLIFNFQLIRHTLSPIISPDDKIVSPFSIPEFPNLPPDSDKHIVPGYAVRTPDSKQHRNIPCYNLCHAKSHRVKRSL